MCLPSGREGFRVALGETRMIKDDFGSAVLYELEFRDRVRPVFQRLARLASTMRPLSATSISRPRVCPRTATTRSAQLPGVGHSLVNAQPARVDLGVNNNDPVSQTSFSRSEFLRP
jgi:hypothetical protein